jgi:putative endonuclease
MNHNQSIGKWGESLAARYLVENGYSILFINWKCPYGELDIIARKEDVISVIEVKTRSGKKFGWPEESVTPVKQEHLINASQAFFDEHEEYSALGWQIDVIAILIESQADQKYQIKHYENAVASL